MSKFDSDKWIEEKKLELINLMFQNEFGIQDFKDTSKVINFDDLQTDTIKDNINKYRTAMAVLFKAEEIRSVLDYYYLQQDKKPVLNLLKQILKYYGYEFCRTSEYQGNYGGKKVYKSKYTIVTVKTLGGGEGSGDEGNIEGDIDIETADDPTLDENQHKQIKKKIITKLVKTFNVDTSDLNHS
jgi:hypothetical protein